MAIYPTLAPTTVRGRIHSIETLGTVDGPGIRYVVFLQGCPLRCAYCHNPDAQDPKAGKEMTAEEVIEDVVRYKSFLKHGGLTVSGGEPLLQSTFVAELFRLAHEHGIHTALDSSGFCRLERLQPVLDHTDLVLLDIKSFHPDTFREVTGVDVRPTLRTAHELNRRDIPTWIRYVLVPGLTDGLAEIRQLAEFIAPMSNVERVEVLPFHKMGETKWKALDRPYRLFDTPTPSTQLVQQVERVFKRAGCPIWKNA